MQKVEIFYRNAYGRQLCYPNNAEARLFAEISRKDTFDEPTLEKVRALGFGVEVVMDPRLPGSKPAA